MVERPADDEVQGVMIALGLDEVFGVGHEGGMGDDDALFPARGAGGEEHVGRAWGHGGVGEPRHLRELSIGKVFLQGHGDAAGKMDGEIVHEGVYPANGTEGNDFPLDVHLRSALLHPGPQLAVGQPLPTLFDGHIVGEKAGVPPQAVFKNLHLSVDFSLHHGSDAVKVSEVLGCYVG